MANGPHEVIREPATWRRPLGVIDADTKRAARAAAGELGFESRRRPVLDEITFGCMVVVAALYIGWLELAAVTRRALRRTRRARPDQLDPAVLEQLRDHARRLAIHKPSTRT